MNGAELQRRWRDGEARFDGVLEDCAFVIQGLLDLYSATHNGDYLEKAIALTATRNRLFADPGGGFFNSRESSAPCKQLQIPGHCQLCRAFCRAGRKNMEKAGKER